MQTVTAIKTHPYAGRTRIAGTTYPARGRDVPVLRAMRLVSPEVPRLVVKDILPEAEHAAENVVTQEDVDQELEGESKPKRKSRRYRRRDLEAEE